jgi:hypothetical protein
VVYGFMTELRNDLAAAMLQVQLKRFGRSTRYRKSRTNGMLLPETALASEAPRRNYRRTGHCTQTLVTSAKLRLRVLARPSKFCRDCLPLRLPHSTINTYLQHVQSGITASQR